MNNEYYGISTPNESFIAHYGIRGMKWGVRKQIEHQPKGYRSRSEAYQKAQKKLMRASSVGGTIGGIAGGLTGGFAGGAIGAAAGSIAGGVASRVKNRKLWKQGAPTRADYNHTVGNRHSNRKPSAQLSKKDKEFISGMKKSANKHGAIGALTVGGGALGGAVGAARYIKQHPKEYEAYKKKYKQMSFKDRMRASFRGH